MSRNCSSLFMFGMLLFTQQALALIVGGEDFDGGSTNGGFTSTNQVLIPDNTADNGQWPGGSFFDRFGIANIAGSLPFDVVDESLIGFPGDRAGVVPEAKTDNFFIMVDLENGDNATSPNASASWDFDISGQQNLSVGIDMGMIGDFGADSGGRNDRFTFTYAIDGGAAQPLMELTSSNDNSAYLVTMADGNEYITGNSFFFFDQIDYDMLGCVTGVANSCASEVTLGGGETIRPDMLDTNQDGVIYEDVENVAFSDTPIDMNDLELGKIQIYEETNGFGTFSQPEFALYKNGLIINGDTNRSLTNQLTTFSETVSGTGSVLTIALDAEQYGGDQFFVFDNITIDASDAPMVDGDFNDDGAYDCADVDALIGEIASANNNTTFDLDADGSVTTSDLTAWLLEAGEANIGPGRAYLNGDANLDGVVDVSDFNIWNAAKFTNVAEWCNGDFSADGVVDVSDFNLWNASKFQTSDSVAAVPEPASLGLFLLGFCGLIRIARRR